MATTKQQIVARVLVLLEALKTAGHVREVKRVNTPYQLTPTTPSAHLIVGDENLVQDEETTQGYALEFPIFIKLTLDSGGDPYDLADALAGQVQAAIEGDLQLSQLVAWIRYQGDDPFTSEETKPRGGTMLTYLVQYRRRRGQPESHF